MSAPRVVPLAPDTEEWNVYVASCGHLFSHALVVQHCGGAPPPPLLACAACEHAIFYFMPRDAVLGLATGASWGGAVPGFALVTQTTPSAASLAYTSAHAGRRRTMRERASETLFWFSVAPRGMHIAFVVLLALVALYAVVDADLIEDHSPFGWLDDVGVFFAGLALALYLLRRLRDSALRETRAYISAA